MRSCNEFTLADVTAAQIEAAIVAIAVPGDPARTQKLRTTATKWLERNDDCRIIWEMCSDFQAIGRYDLMMEMVEFYDSLPTDPNDTTKTGHWSDWVTGMFLLLRTNVVLWVASLRQGFTAGGR
jgi:hypothetical protein